MSRNLPGFSLIEMAVVLIIIGVVSGIALPTLKTMLDWQKEKTTAHHQEQILYALASYANKNKFLPYAANPTNQDGIQDRETRRRRGIVPYSNLGLPESVAKDGHQRWFTYVVDDFYAEPMVKAVANPTYTNQENTLCKDHKLLNPLRIKGVPENVAVVLISHGPEGRGVYPHPTLNPPKRAHEQQNSQSDQEIIDRPLSYDLSNPFSHKVVWVTAKNLLAIYGHAPCPPTEVRSQTGTAKYQAPTTKSADTKQDSKKS